MKALNGETPSDWSPSGSGSTSDLPVLSVAPARATEGTPISFTVTLRPMSSQIVTVDYATSVEPDDTAVPGTDYTETSGMLRFAAGDTTKTVSVPTAPDTDTEDDTFTLTLSNPSNATLLRTGASANGSILEDIYGTDDDDGTTSPPTGTGGGGGGGGSSGPSLTVNLMAVGGDGQVVLTWEAPASDGGTAITDYEVRINQTGEWISTGSTETTYTVTGLDNDTEYTFQVRAVNGNRKGRTSLPVEATPRAAVTLLVANFMNGNNGAFNSRVYLWNPSTSAGQVTVRVFTLPLTFGIARELTGPPLDLGTLEARSALNLKLVEDILIPLGIALPYTDDGGNLMLEFTIEAPDVKGAAQIFSSDFAFGTYPMQEILSTPSGNPTVLVANFTNGNNGALHSRVYLWNPSASAGEVTVRVFTLPQTGNSSLLGTLDLESLQAESARNLKLAEDILTPLGIPTPYVTDGGNLTLEFTIQAADVRGAAQVFSSSFAFGTVPLQVIQ